MVVTAKKKKKGIFSFIGLGNKSKDKKNTNKKTSKKSSPKKSSSKTSKEPKSSKSAKIKKNSPVKKQATKNSSSSKKSKKVVKKSSKEETSLKKKKTAEVKKDAKSLSRVKDSKKNSEITKASQFSIAPGFYKIFLKDGRCFEGQILERPTTYKEGYITLKLKNGYNIGIKKENILRKVKVKAQVSATVSKERKIQQKLKEPKVLILHCGGTIASKIDYKTGGVSAQFSSNYLLEKVPELLDLAYIDSKLLMNLLSENIRFAHYNLIVKEIANAVKKYDAIILTHGTDTMHYTSAALSFMLQGLKIPIVIVGAQRSSDRPSSDAWTNLYGAVLFAVKAKLPGVWVAMHQGLSDDYIAIYKGLNVRKMHSSRRDAFKPINTKQVARVNVEEKKVEVLLNTLELKKIWSYSEREFKVTQINPDLKIAFIKSHPNMFASEIKAFKNFDAIILEGTGLGHLPVEKIDEFTSENLEVYKAIQDLAKRSFVVMTTQTIYGNVNLHVYSSGRKLLYAGVEGSGLTIAPETLFIKVAWLLSNYSKDEAREKLYENIVGELEERTLL